MAETERAKLLAKEAALAKKASEDEAALAAKVAAAAAALEADKAAALEAEDAAALEEEKNKELLRVVPAKQYLPSDKSAIL